MRNFDRSKLPGPFHRLCADWLREKSAGALDLELGAGDGAHAMAYAKLNPSRHLIAIERTQNRFQKFESRMHLQGCPLNLSAFRDEAVRFCSANLTPGSISRIFLLYPNPYPKARQANRRWHRSPFAAYLHELLKPGGQIVLSTNLEWYSDEARAYFSNCWKLSCIESLRLENTGEFRTSFEKKYLERGESCFSLRFEKSA